MRVAIAGGSGFIGSALARALTASGHEVLILTRGGAASPLPAGVTRVSWDGRSGALLAEPISQVQAVVNLAGESLSNWPWSAARKQRFLDSRVLPGLALVEAIRAASPRPQVFLQASGINHYGLSGPLAGEDTPAGDDFLARLTVAWEQSTAEVEQLGVRRCIARLGVVLGRGGGLLPLMALPARLFAGGPLGSGRQALPWIHLEDVSGALSFLLDHPDTRGPYNLVAPEAVTNADFNRALARSLHRPYWLPAPAFLLRLVLGEMSVLILAGRPAVPKRLLAAGYSFRYGSLAAALQAALGQ